MTGVLLAPRRYIQGDGAVHQIGTHASRLGRRALLIGGSRALAACGTAVEASLGTAGLSLHTERFGGECCAGEIDRLAAVARREHADLVIAAGGGKVIDTGKAVALAQTLPIIVLPTIAATDAPCSTVMVIYTEDGRFDHYAQLPHNPDCILVDTGLIARAPVRTLVAGMGDALSTYWEADTCARSGRTNPLTGSEAPLRTALALARLCYDTLLEYGVQAKRAAETGGVTPALEAIVEANTLLSGLGFESGGLAGAHAIHNGLTRLPACHDRLHGEKVAFGTLVQLVMEGRPDAQVREVLGFCRSVGLPVCLSDLGLGQASRDEIRIVAEAAAAPDESIHAAWFTVTPARVEAAIWAADAIATGPR